MRLIAIVVACVAFTACDRSAESGGGMGGMMEMGMGGSIDTTGLRSLTIPAEHQRGLELYDQTCAVCHGEAGLGTTQGPPLIHIVYEPNHHADAAFILAAERGVRAHHWRFGDMPPQPTVTRDEVLAITAYIRWLQRQAGVY